MQIELREQAIADFKFWQKSGNKIIQRRIEILLSDMLLHPFSGVGKPEALKYNLSGK